MGMIPLAPSLENGGTVIPPKVPHLGKPCPRVLPRLGPSMAELSWHLAREALAAYTRCSNPLPPRGRRGTAGTARRVA